MSQNVDLERGVAGSKTSTKIHHHRDGSKTVTKTVTPMPGTDKVEEVTEEYSMIQVNKAPEVMAHAAPQVHVQPQYDPSASYNKPALNPQGSAQVVINNHATMSATGGGKSTSGNAVGSMICGIIGFFFFGIILGPIAICLGVNAKNEIKMNPGMDGDCQATTGIVMGIIDVVGWLILIIIFASA